MKDLRIELQQLEFELKIINKVPCDESEIEKYKKLRENNEELPKGVIHDTTDTYYENVYYKNIRSDLTDDEIRKLLLYRQAVNQKTQTEHLKSIKYGVIFFVVLTVLSLIGTIITIARATGSI